MLSISANISIVSSISTNKIFLISLFSHCLSFLSLSSLFISFFVSFLCFLLSECTSGVSPAIFIIIIRCKIIIHPDRYFNSISSVALFCTNNDLKALWRKCCDTKYTLTIICIVYVHCREEGCIGLYIPDDQKISQGHLDI